MLTNNDIRRLTDSAVYMRGAGLYKHGDVDDFYVENIEDGEWYLGAKVMGGSKYDVELIYDDKSAGLSHSFCSCPAFSNYGGLCKHCIAVLLEFIDYQEAHPLLFMDRLKGNGKKKLPAEAKRTETTPLIKELLVKNFMQKTFPVVHKDMYGKVRLEPYLTLSARQLEVEFRIGISKMYVLKDVFEFEKNMKDAVQYSYGKQLEFLHMKEAFAPESQKMADFLIRWAKKNAERFLSYYNYFNPYRQNYQKVRKLDLDARELEEFLEATEYREFYANCYGEGERKWKVTPDKPERKMTIEGKPEGIEVSVKKMLGFVGEKYILYFQEGLIYLVEREEVRSIEDFLLCMAQVPDYKAFIRREDVPVFCSQLFPELEKFYECSTKNFDVSEYLQPPVTFKIYLDMPQKDFITCRLFAVYGENGEEKYNLFGGEQDKNIGVRDIFKELETSQAVASYFNAYDEAGGMMALSGDEGKLYDLLAEGIPKMQEIGEVFVSDALKRIHVMPAPKVSMGISLAGDMLELSVSTGDMPMEQLAEILSRYDRKRKYYRLKNGSFVDVEDGELGILARLKDEMCISDRQMKQDHIVLPKFRALYLDGELKANPAFGAVKDRNFKELVRNMKTVEDNDFEIPPSLDDIMREYQKKGFLWIKTLKSNGFGGILADDMGLGKTLQVIAFLLSEYIDAAPQENKRCLIVAPASLVFNWSSEIERFAPALHVKTVTGTAAERKEIILDSGERDILLTSYDLLRRDIENYEGIRFYCQVIDEAQYIKNHNTQAAKAVKEIEAGFRLALTGTPVENRLSELWSIFDYLMPGFLYAYQRFRESIEIPVVQGGSEEAMKKLQKLIGPFVLRRLKKDVLKDLPDKLEENMYAKLEGEQQKLYDAHVQRMRMMLDKTSEEEFRTSKIQILAELTKLRQICCDPALIFENYKENSGKMDLCMDLVHNAVNGGHKLLLFSQFTSMLDRIKAVLDREGIGCYMLTGATPKEKRVKMVDAFNKDDTPVFCISLKAGGTGLNLTAADVVIHYDPWWNLAVQNQATDRAHRIGQKNVVNVYKLIVKGTIEDNIVKLQERKKELAEQVLGGEGMGSGSFTKEELLELLQ